MEQPEVIQDSATAQAAPEPDALDQDLLDEALPDGQQAEDDEIEDELDGVKVSGKKAAVEKLKSERLMNADYTRKTQAAAEEKRAVEAERASIKQSAQMYQAHLDVVADLVSMDKQIEQFQRVDWDALSDTDPVQAQKLDRQFRALQERKQQGMHALGQLQQRHAFEEQQSAAKRLEQAAAVLAKEVPGWSQARDNELRDFVVKQGVPAEAVREIVMRAPGLGKVFDMAAKYAALVAKQSTKPKAEAQDAPVTRISATRASASKDPSAMTDADFAAWRRRQIAQRR